MTAAGAPSPRNRLGATTFIIAALGAVLACIPATVALGGLLSLAVIIPAILSVRRCRKGVADNRHRSVAALVLAPVFFIVAVILTPPAPGVATTTVSKVESLTAAASASPTVSATAIPERASSPPRPAPSPTTKIASPAPPARVATPAPARARVVAPAAASASATASDGASGVSSACDESTHYVNSSGNCVLRPVQAAVAPSGATAKCVDGSYSSSQHRQGTCSRHGGVAAWL